MQYLMLIGGRKVGALSGDTIPVENPANREIYAEIPRGGAEDVDLAVRAASMAFAQWRKVPARDRGKLLIRVAEAVERVAEDLAIAVARETGNALRTQARGEVKLAADVFRYFGGLASELKGETIPLGELVLSYTRREPLGVVGAIVPWNAPLLLSALKVAPAVCAGNTVVLKAAEDASLAVLMLGDVLQGILPEGVVNVITGRGDEAGAALVAHAGVQKLSFTGSTLVGKHIMHAAADRIVPVSLELGGKSPSIVYPDADAPWVVDGVLSAMRFTRQSQSCTAGSRLFVHESVIESFVDSLSKKMKSYKIGDPLDEESDIGSLINEKQFNRVMGYVEEGLNAPSARLITGGMPPKDGPLSKGYFALPTLFVQNSNDWRLAREEIFGPVLVAIPWKDEEEVIRMANSSHYGLAAYIWTQDVGRALRTAHAIEAGWVQVNQGLGQSLGQPYGGYKQSGIGREFSLDSMLDSFTQRKAVTVNLER